MNKKIILPVILVLTLLGCAKEGKRGENAFLNGDFEKGTAPWFFLEGNPNWLGFSVSQGMARSGKSSARILVDAGPDKSGTKVYGVIQEVSPPRFPDTISGYYRVEKWKRGTPKQYLQFVVIVWGDPAVKKWSNHQIRYILTGVDKPPFRIGNAKFEILGPKEPVMGEWVFFERKVGEDFMKHWGGIPSGYSKIRVLFEARYDGKRKGSKDVFAEVYYDDLFFGWKGSEEK